MSKYTTMVKNICESLNNYSINPDNYNEQIAEAAPKIFDNYPIFSEEHRAELNKKILKHFYFREICSETYAQWKFYLNRELEEIMPYYNELFKSQDIFDGIATKDLFNNINVQEVGSEIGNESRKGESEGFDESSGLSSETRELLGKEKERADYKGGETTTKSIAGKEKDTEKITGSETDTEKITGSETDTETLSGSEIDAKTGHDDTENDNINRVSKHWESDTPQGTIANVDNESYLTKYSKDQELGSTKDTTTYNSTNTKSFNNRQNENVKTFTNRQNENTKTFANRQNENEHEYINREDTDTQLYNNRYDEHERSFENRKDNTIKIDNNKNRRNETTGETASRIANNVKKIIGKNTGDSYMDLIQKIRDIIINIDMMIINDLENCFMCIW